jgi:hypothetical protein
LAAALGAAGIDVQTTPQAGRRGSQDPDQLTLAAVQGRGLCTSNIRDYAILDREWSAAGKHHSGILFTTQRQWSIGEKSRPIQALWQALSAEEMSGRTEYLQNWGDR